MQLSPIPAKNLSKKLQELFSLRDAYALITYLDGTSVELKPETKGSVEVGLDYLAIDVEVNAPGPLPHAPTIIPFSSIKSIDVVA